MQDEIYELEAARIQKVWNESVANKVTTADMYGAFLDDGEIPVEENGELNYGHEEDDDDEQKCK